MATTLGTNANRLERTGMRFCLTRHGQSRGRVLAYRARCRCRHGIEGPLVWSHTLSLLAVLLLKVAASKSSTITRVSCVFRDRPVRRKDTNHVFFCQACAHTHKYFSNNAARICGGTLTGRPGMVGLCMLSRSCAEDVCVCDPRHFNIAKYSKQRAFYTQRFERLKPYIQCDMDI